MGHWPNLPPVPTSTAPIERERPWWGLGDVALAIPAIFGFAILGTALGIAYALIWEGWRFGDGFDINDQASIPLAIVCLALIGQQLGQFLWPLYVSRQKGRGMKQDFGWGLNWHDVGIGLAAGLGLLVMAGVAGFVISQIAGDIAEESSNTDFLTDAKDSPWVIVLIIAVTLGAPITEELLFRGLVLRAWQKRSGATVAVIGSTILFTAVHYQGGSLVDSLPLFIVIGLLGAGLALLTLRTNRLTPAIIAHMLFNTVGAAAALL